jgi:hypothetical protein
VEKTKVALEMGTPYKGSLGEGSNHERWYHGTPGQEVSYKFEADAQIGFSVTYRKGDETIYAVPRKRTGRTEGTFTVEEEADYLFKWENSGGKRVPFSYTIDLVK